MNCRHAIALLGLLVLLALASRGRAEWGVAQDGLRLQLVPQKEEYILGEPMIFHLDIMNQRGSPITIVYTEDDIDGDDFIIFGPNDSQVVYKGSGEYPGKNLSLQLMPGVPRTLIKARDLSLEYSIRSPGRYTVQYVQKIWDRTSTQLPPSNRVNITVTSNKD